MISQADVRALIDFEAQRQTVGCEDASSPSCLAEISDALGVDRMVAGSVSNLGSHSAIHLTLSDIKSAKVTGRVEASVDNDADRLRSFAANAANALLSGGELQVASPWPGVVGVAGGVAALAGLAGLAVAELTLQNANGARPDKDGAVTLGRVATGVTVVGAVVGAAGGAVVLLAGE
ncbi:MAG: hypothetical protein Q8O67_10990 [Deltaproteobacteria bacterium]|nr:hypothetical protein [Deltaproteobacteria bacterium]